MLIEVIERRISEPMTFDTLEQAQGEMAVRFAQAMGIKDINVDDVRSKLEEGGYHSDDFDTIFDAMMARCERHGENYDWMIFQMRCSEAWDPIELSPELVARMDEYSK